MKCFWGDFLEDVEFDLGPEICGRFWKMAKEAPSNRGRNERARGKEGLVRMQD